MIDPAPFPGYHTLRSPLYPPTSISFISYTLLSSKIIKAGDFAHIPNIILIN